MDMLVVLPLAVLNSGIYGVAAELERRKAKAGSLN